MDKGTDNMQNPGRPRNGGRMSRQARLILAVVVIVSLAVAAVVVYLYLNRSDESDGGTPVETAIQNSNEAFDVGNYQQAQEELEDALAETDDVQEKIQLYTNLSATAASDGKVQEAINYLTEKHKLAPETAKEDAYILAQYYERLENNQEALKQYEIALDYLQSLPSSDQLDINNRIQGVKARIAELKGQ